MALYHKYDVKNGFPYALQFFSLISDGLGGESNHVLINWPKIPQMPKNLSAQAKNWDLNGKKLPWASLVRGLVRRAAGWSTTHAPTIYFFTDRSMTNTNCRCFAV